MTRSPFPLLFVAALGLCGPFSGNAQSQAWPTKPIKIMVGFAAGGASDVTARLISPRLTESLGQPIVIENRGGSGGLLATDAVAKSAPDGYTLLLMPAADTIQPAVRRKLPYDLERDFAPVGRMVFGPWFLVVHNSVPARNVKELIALAKASPGRLNYATSGTGSSAHLATEILNATAKVSMVHIPYKGTSEGVVAVATGQADLIFASIPAATPLMSVGRVRALAVTTGKRTSLAPEMPTLIESGVPGYDRSGWYGMLAPAAVPREIVTRLNAAIVRIMNTPDMQEAFRRQGLDPAPTTPEEFGAFIRSEVAQNIKVVKDAGIKLE